VSSTKSAVSRQQSLCGYPLHEITRHYADFTPAELAALREDIRTNGQRVPVAIWRGQIVDGRHRATVSAELGLKLIVHDIGEMTEEAMRAYVASLNQHRRSRTTPLTNEEKRQRVEVALKADPARSNVAIAEETGTTDPFVLSVRKDLEAKGVLMVRTPQERRSRTGKTGEGARRGVTGTVRCKSSVGLRDDQPPSDVATKPSETAAAPEQVPEAGGSISQKLDDRAPTGDPEELPPSRNQPDQPNIETRPYRSRAAQAAEQRAVSERVEAAVNAEIERKAEELSGPQASPGIEPSPPISPSANEPPYILLVPARRDALTAAWDQSSLEEQRQLLNKIGAVVLRSDESLQRLRGLYIAALHEADQPQLVAELRSLFEGFGLKFPLADDAQDDATQSNETLADTKGGAMPNAPSSPDVRQHE
jgi:ParB-like chromosome segregation protein Spo0J